jgi:hypothetical protein
MAARKKAGEEPRLKVPVYFADEEPIYLCEFCDGDALPMARDLEAASSGE